MTDDIVPRLDLLTCYQRSCGKGTDCIICDAVDEIERLRSANAHQARLVKYFLNNAVPYIKHRSHCFAWWEHQSNEDCRCGAGEAILAYEKEAHRD